jgi:hypothetical protein
LLAIPINRGFIFLVHAFEFRFSVSCIAAEAYAKKYKDKIEPDLYSACSYDAVNLLALAIKNANSTKPEEIQKALHGIKGYKGVEGTYTFDKNGDALHGYKESFASRSAVNMRYGPSADRRTEQDLNAVATFDTPLTKAIKGFVGFKWNEVALTALLSRLARHREPFSEKTRKTLFAVPIPQAPPKSGHLRQLLALRLLQRRGRVRLTIHTSLCLGPEDRPALALPQRRAEFDLWRQTPEAAGHLLPDDAAQRAANSHESDRPVLDLRECRTRQSPASP